MTLKLLKLYFALIFLSQPSFAALKIKVLSPELTASVVLSDDENEQEHQIYLKSSVDRKSCLIEIKGFRTLIYKDVDFAKGKRKIFEVGNFNTLLRVKLKKCETEGSNQVKKNVRITKFQINNDIKRLLNYLKSSQIKKTKGYSRFSGEWGSQAIIMKTLPLVGSRGTQAWDSNCFTTSAIYNVLAPIYLKHRQYNQIVPMLNRAMRDIERCKEGETYTFWHKVKLPKKYQKNYSGLIRNPNNFVFNKYSVHGFSNIVNDSDDTSSSFISKMYQEKISSFDSRVRPPKKRLIGQNVSHYFDNYRDVGRKVRHPWDFYKSRMKNTGAYLTWFGKESKKNGFFYKSGRKHIPLEINDVDCVVNANILKMFAISGTLHKAKGVPSACRYLNKIAMRRISNDKCTLYYPNSYNIHFALSEAYQAGVNCLQPVKNKLLLDLLKNQNADGSWNSTRRRSDVIQSTVYALNGILNFDPKLYYQSSKRAVRKSLKYLSRHSKINTRRRLSLPGGSFFSGGSFAKTAVVWKSDAITTSYYLQALIKISTNLKNGELK
jgi:hypothetical protein